MNKEQTENAIKVMQAFADGKIIEVRYAGSGGKWNSIFDPAWNWRDKEYRIQPEVEPIDVFLRRSERFGPYLKDVEQKEYFQPQRITKEGIIHRGNLITFNILQNTNLYTWSGGERIFTK